MSYGGTKGARGGILVRYETRDGLVKWRHLTSLDHSALCSSGGLDPCSTWFDVPKSFWGGSGSQGRDIEGRIHQGHKDSPPIGKITICREGQKFAERDHAEQMRQLGCVMDEPRDDRWMSRQ